MSYPNNYLFSKLKKFVILNVLVIIIKGVSFNEGTMFFGFLQNKMFFFKVSIFILKLNFYMNKNHLKRMKNKHKFFSNNFKKNTTSLFS